MQNICMPDMLKELVGCLLFFNDCVRCVRSSVLTGHSDHFPGLPAFFSVLCLPDRESRVEGVVDIGWWVAMCSARLPDSQPLGTWEILTHGSVVPGSL